MHNMAPEFEKISGKEDGLNILILEDDNERVKCFKKNFFGCNLTFTCKVDICIEQLESNTFDVLFLDHDLGGEVYVESGKGVETGHDVAKWLSNNLDKSPKDVIVHSLNPVGADNMVKLIPGSKKIPFAWLKLKYEGKNDTTD